MALNSIRKLYRHTPEFFRKPIEYIPIKYRLGGSEFAETYSFLERSETWSRERLKKYQRKKLRELLRHTVETVPYYRDLELTNNDSFQDLKRFPIIDKETIRENRSKFKSDSIDPKKTYNVTTGGTSGEPFSFILDDSSYSTEWAFIMYGWSRVGYSPGEQLITFKAIDYEKTDKDIYWKYNPLYNTYEFSPYHLKSENIGSYTRKINEIDPEYIHGYPSAITKLANLIQNSSKPFPEINGVFAASENVYEAQRDIIEDTFDTRLFSHYGQSEKVALAAECEHSNRYHLYPQYGLVEILDERGNEVAIGETGEIVATGFLSKSMPFIRYRTGDYATKGEVGNCSCGREYRILTKIKGREEKERSIYIDDSHKIAIHLVYYAMHGDALDGVGAIQFHQVTPGELTVRIEPQKELDSVDEYKIIDAIQGKVGEDFGVDIQFVETVELTESGKRQLLIQEYTP
jgi:phenylacetate-CoA ligase